MLNWLDIDPGLLIMKVSANGVAIGHRLLWMSIVITDISEMLPLIRWILIIGDPALTARSLFDI